jgi:hypothetical protein
MKIANHIFHAGYFEEILLEYQYIAIECIQLLREFVFLELVPRKYAMEIAIKIIHAGYLERLLLENPDVDLEYLHLLQELGLLKRVPREYVREVADRILDLRKGKSIESVPIGLVNSIMKFAEEVGDKNAVNLIRERPP